MHGADTGSGTARKRTWQTRRRGANTAAASAPPIRWAAVSPRHSHSPQTTAASRCAITIPAEPR
jgi:hypothetical protein